jgi:4-carboxymuconolactone decarboxylase
MSESERRQLGRETFRDVMGFEVSGEPQGDPFVESGLLDTVFAELWNRDGLTRKERRIITVVCVGASAYPVAAAAHVRAALESGDLTVDELRELILQFAYYAGFPRASALNNALREYLQEQAGG